MPVRLPHSLLDPIFAFVLVALALLARWLLAPWLGADFAFTTLYPAVALAALRLAWPWAVGVALAGYLGCLPLVLPDFVGRGAQPLGLWAGSAVYLAGVALIIGGIQRLRRQQSDLRQALEAGERSRRDLAESEQRFQRMADAAPVLIWISGRDKGRQWCNRQWLDFVGRPLQSEAGRGWLDNVHPGDRERLTQIFEASFDGREPYSLEYRLRHRDGDYRWVIDNGVPLHEGGAFLGYIGSSLDITERKQAEASQMQVYALVESSDEFVGMCDLNMRPYYVNAAGLEMVGLNSLEELEGIRVGDFIHPEDRPYVFGEFLQRVQHEGQAEAELRFRHFRSGETLWVIYSVVVLIDENGAPCGYGTHTRNITQRKKSEQALRRADRRKDEFLATLAHELRNPLAPIRNSLEILKLADGRPDLLGEARDTIERQVSHMVRLVDDLLDLSRITRDHIELRRSRVDLATLLQQCLEAVQPLVENSGLRLRSELPPERLALHADPVRLAQVFGNLLHNACKFTDPGGSIHLRAWREGDEARVLLRDSGTGIAPDNLEDIFDMFSQVDGTLARSPGGLGIGLTLVKRLVELHGGQVEVRSEGLDKGSEFLVCLPLAAGVETPRAKEKVFAPSSTPACRILVVDDNRDSAESLALLLELSGHDTRIAFDGLEALALAADYQPHLVLLDIGLPKLDGLEVCRRLRATGDGERLTIVALTGWGQDDDRRRSQEAGFDDHLVKPVDQADLQRVLLSVDCSVV